MNRITKVSIGGLVALILAGCSAKGPQFNGFQKAQNGKSNVYIYRKSYLGGSITPNIHQTNLSTNRDKVIGSVKPNGYIVTTVAPGRYKYWAKTEAQNEVVLQVGSNRNYCIKHYISLGILVGHPQFKTIDMRTCTEEIKGTHLSR